MKVPALVTGPRPRRIRRAAAVWAGLLAVAAGAAAAGLPAAAAGIPSAGPAALAAAASALTPACPAARAGFARCLVLYRPQTTVNRALADGAAASPAGWGATALESAYKLPVSRKSRQTVAVSIAFNTPRLANYLAVYRKGYGLPGCTTANGCFRKVNQRGKSSHLPPPGVGSGWDLEATLDVSMISAACPHCRILVVEADDDSIANLARSENTAARLGATVISNSYGAREDGYTQTFAASYHHPGHTIVVSAGDLGYTAANFPANTTTVTAVGGTTLTRAATARGWAEATWNDDSGAGGSGCSAYVPKPAWQHDSDCAMRTIADVSAVASNIPIYNKDWGGWLTVGGTSVSAPFIAGVYGLAGNAARVTPSRLYARTAALFDVTGGNNDWFTGTAGAACGFGYLCVAGPGYDGPTGLGSPDGIGAF